MSQGALKTLKKEAGFKNSVLYGDQSWDKVLKYCKAMSMLAVNFSEFFHPQGRFKRGWLSFAASTATGPQPLTSASSSETSMDI